MVGSPIDIRLVRTVEYNISSSSTETNVYRTAKQYLS